MSTEGEIQNSVNIEKLFDLKRTKSFSDLFLICLYFPIGLCLLVIRAFIFLYMLFVSSIFPKSSSVKRFLFLVLGVVVQDDELPSKNFDEKHFLCNRVSDIDSIVLNLIHPCIFFSSIDFPKYVSWICDFSTVTERNQSSKDKLLLSIKEKTPVVCFPESSCTNGKVALFKFETWPFSCDLNFHLIFIETQRPFFNITISPLDSSWLSNLFWILFLPFTIFNIRNLGSIKRNENESVEDFSKRAQTHMAEAMKMKFTNYSLSDKKELIKRLNDNQRFNKRTLKSSANVDSLSADCILIEDMATRVKDVLPQVPIAIIKRDVKITKNIDSTIERILTGVVKYIPEPSCPKGDKNSPSTSTNNTTNDTQVFFGAATFGKTTSERALSFEQRKQQLFRVARMRYIKKYGLN